MNSVSPSFPAAREFHMSLRVADKAAVNAAHHAALAEGAPIVLPLGTTWSGTPLHELWLRDPSGYPIEVYARLTDAGTATGAA